MKATIITKEHELFGKVGYVKDILCNKIAVLRIDGRVIDFGLSEVEIEPCFEFGRHLIIDFSDYDTILSKQKYLKIIAKKGSIVTSQSYKNCLKSVNQYNKTQWWKTCKL